MAPAQRLLDKNRDPSMMSAQELQQAQSDEAFLKSIEMGDVEAVVAAKRSAADLNIADETKCTTVHKAVRSVGDEECNILQHLVAGGAFIEFEDRDGARPIMHAIRAGNQKALQLFLDLRDIRGGRVVDLKQVIKTSGHNLLHECAWYDRHECARLLLATEAFGKEDLTLPNKQGQSVMHVASFRAAPPFLQLLVEYGGDVTAECSNGGRNVAASPQELAAAMGKPHNAKYLHELGAAVHAIRFASKMRAKRMAGLTSPEEQPPCLRLRLEFDLQLFTADLEKSFIAKLAKAAACRPAEVLVLSKASGSVILEIELRVAASEGKSSQANSALALARIERMPAEDLGEAIGYNVLSRSVGPRSSADGSNASEQPSIKSPRATPGYAASPAMARKGAGAAA